MSILLQRMIRAAKLDPSLYEEVEHDQSALSQAAIVVILSSVAVSIGAMSLKGGLNPFVFVFAALLGWVIWAALVYIIGVKLLPLPQTESNIKELMRTIGFSSAPGIIRVIGIIPGLFNIVSFVAQIWMLLAMVIAVRQALDYSSTPRAIAVCVIGWLIQMVFLGLLLR